jgi:hypothetical protein
MQTEMDQQLFQHQFRSILQRLRQVHGLDLITPRQIRDRLPYAIFIGCAAD